MDKVRLLVIDDDAEICRLLCDLGETCGYETSFVQKVTEFENSYHEFKPNFIILDLSIADSDGVEILRFLQVEKSKSSVIMMSGHGEKIRAAAFRLGQSYNLNMIAHLQKPVNLAELKQILNRSNGVVPSIEKLADAIKNFNLILHYQPKVLFSNNKIVGVEALVRWKPVEKPLIFPDAFISLAEQSGLIKPLTRWVIEQSLQQIANWEKEGISLKVAINLSPIMLTDLSFPDEVVELAKKYNADVTKVCFEITETGVMSQPQVAMDILTRLRLKGLELSIDDFGIGYSSLTELYRMPFSEMKIDRSFILNVMKDNEAKVITRSIIDLGHNLGITLVAEGVEDEQIWNYLKESKCDIAQGYYISRPISASDLKVWLQENADENLIYRHKNKGLN